MSEKFTMHETRGDVCPGCHKPIVEGDAVTLVPIGPGEDDEERKKARNGRAYNAVAVVAHYGCVTGFPE